MWSQVIDIKKIECMVIVHNNLTGAKEPGPAVPFNLSFIDYWRDSPKFSYVEPTLDLTFLRF
ncbi:hypothetical protein APS47_05670 [Leptospira kirschneri serovar Mozdok]|nr:hypothetical protein APS47_05670 [Leptospira kirschneri serovar Mozdok]